jgi:pSer/pThr/pTyr-binding forkhead associated (FHA) protein
VFHDKEPRVVHTHPVVNDITLVGREDPQRDVFPDLDLGKLPAGEVSSGHASRQHLRLLRQGSRYYLYVYKGSTGTQVCDRMVDPAQYGKRFEIQVGDRIILGGKVRMKLARVK